jgi:hypothetical protein
MAAFFRANWREPQPRPLKGTLPNGWIYRCADLEAASSAEAEEKARRLVSAQGEFLAVFAVERDPARAPLAVVCHPRSAA